MAMQFCTICCTPRAPKLPAPRSTRDVRREIRKWLDKKLRPEDLDDDLIWADNNPARLSTFDPANHRKYNAQVYFRKDQKEGARTALERWQMSDPQRGAKAQMAYDDFLFGLEVIGQQEYLVGTHGKGNILHTTGRQMSDADRAEILRELMPASVPDGRDDVKRLQMLAEWERILTLRRNSRVRRMWYLNLKKRAMESDAELFNATETERPELDFDPLKYMQRIFSMLILLVSLVSQILLIISLCPDAYMCPVNAAWPHRPVLAPPVEFRRNTGFLATTNDYFHTTRNSCEYGAAGCADPGYSVQWPYLEVEGGNLTVPRQLSLSCKRRSRGDDGWMWDNYLSEIRPEFWDCRDVESLTFVEGNTPFHFDLRYYEEAHRVTLACMRKLTGTKDADVWAKTDWSSIERRRDLEVCFMSEVEYRDNGFASECQCETSENFQYFVVGSIAESDIPLHQKYGCFFDSPTAREKFPVSYHSCSAVPRTTLFKGRLAKDAEKEQIQQERERSVFARLSGTGRIAGRKTVALLIFLAKEGGPITALVVMPMMVLVIAVLFAIIRLVYSIVQLFVCGGSPAKAQFELGCWLLWEELFWQIVNIVWAICYRSSSTWNFLSKLRRCFFAKQVNHSLVHDGSDQITSMVNIVFNLVALVYSDVRFEGGSEGYAFGLVARGSWLWSSMVLSIVNIALLILLSQERLTVLTGFMKDVNENRLSKFEFALGITKVLEDFLEDDIHFNFVQHFYDDERVSPFESDDFGETTAAEKSQKDPDETEMLVDSLRAAKCVCCAKFSVENKPINLYSPVIPEKYLHMFGHDGLFEHQGEMVPAVSKAFQSNRLRKLAAASSKPNAFSFSDGPYFSSSGPSPAVLGPTAHLRLKSSGYPHSNPFTLVYPPAPLHSMSPPPTSISRPC